MGSPDKAWSPRDGGESTVWLTRRRRARRNSRRGGIAEPGTPRGKTHACGAPAGRRCAREAGVRVGSPLPRNLRKGRAAPRAACAHRSRPPANFQIRVKASSTVGAQDSSVGPQAEQGIAAGRKIAPQERKTIAHSVSCGFAGQGVEPPGRGRKHRVAHPKTPRSSKFTPWWDSGARYSSCKDTCRYSFLLPRPELYNLARDPDESYDVALENLRIVAQLQEQIAEMVGTFSDPVQKAWAGQQAWRSNPAVPAGGYASPMK